VDKHGMTAQEWESKHVILDQGAFNMFQLTKMPPCQTTSLNMLPQREFRKHTYIYIYQIRVEQAKGKQYQPLIKTNIKV
jgi:hypothetical protein